VHGAAGGAGAADTGFAELTQRAARAQCVLEGAQLAIGFGGTAELRLNELGALLAKPMKLEHQAADVAQLQLPPLAQIAGTTPNPRALLQPGGRRQTLLYLRGRPAVGLELPA
jgi:hypothetical protein